MSPQLRHLRYFVAVAEEKSFTRAAQRLSVAQQAVSATVRQLELELGAPLLTRSTRRVELTASGEVLLETGKAALDAFDVAWRSVRTVRPEAGTLSVAYDPIVGHGLVTKAHSLLVDRFPDLHASWRPRYNAELAPELAIGRFDAALAVAPEVITGLGYEDVGVQALKVIVGRRHRLARRRTVDPAELLSEAVYVLPRDLGPRFFDALAGVWEGAASHPRLLATPDPRGSATLEHYVRLAAVGLSTAWVVDEFVERSGGRVVSVPLKTDLLLPVTVLWCRDAPEARLRAFKEVCRVLAAGTATVAASA